MATSIPKELPADDRRVEETQCAKWSAAMTVGFYRPPAPCTVGRFVFFWKGHLITRIGADAKWGVIDRQISYQIKNLYPKNILYNPLHHWTFLDIRMSELFWTHRVLFVSVLRCGPPESINLLVPNWVKKKWGLFMYGRGFKSSYNSAVLMPDGFKPSWNMFKHMDTSIIVNI